MIQPNKVIYKIMEKKLQRSSYWTLAVRNTMLQLHRILIDFIAVEDEQIDNMNERRRRRRAKGVSETKVSLYALNTM